MTTSAAAEVLVDSRVEAIWAVVVDPANHHLFDGTGMVQGLAVGSLHAVGDVFTMDMMWRGNESVERYQSDNHVTVLEPMRRIGWAAALPGGLPLGWTWTYDFESAGERATRVRLTYDWSRTSPENIERFGVPLADEADLWSSLRLLRRVVLTH